MKSKGVQDLIHKVALNNSLSDAELKKIITSIFKFQYILTANTGNRKNNYDFKSLLVPYFGKFKVNKKAVANARAKLKREEDEKD